MITGIEVTVDGVPFYGSYRDRGLIIGQGGWEGWDDGVDTRLDDIAMPGRAGSFDVPGFDTARYPVLSGTAVEPTPADLAHTRQVFGSLLRGLGRVTVLNRAGDVSWAWARVNGQRRFRVDSDGLTAEFLLPMKCPSPDLFGAYTESEPATETTFHQYGNAPAWQTYKVSGSASGGYTLWLGGTAFVVTAPLVSGHPHTIDMQTGTLSIDGVRVFGETPVANVWSVPPWGESITVNITFAGGSGSFVGGTYETSR